MRKVFHSHPLDIYPTIVEFLYYLLIFIKSRLLVCCLIRHYFHRVIPLIKSLRLHQRLLFLTYRQSWSPPVVVASLF
jgi:hypothetical protein